MSPVSRTYRPRVSVPGSVRVAAICALALAMPAPPLVAVTVGVRLEEPLPTFYACVAVLLAAAAALGSIAVPGAGRGWVVERVGVIAVIGWAAGFDVAMLARAFLSGAAGGDTGAFLCAAGAYVGGTAWTFSAARDFEWRWILTCVASVVVWLAVAALW
jgi:hypothetical protein